MGKPEDPEFERRIRREVYERFKAAKKENQQLSLELNRALAYIKVLEGQLEGCADIVALAEKIITEGTESDREMAVAGVDEKAAG
jgi:hypothetical protein